MGGVCFDGTWTDSDVCTEVTIPGTRPPLPSPPWWPPNDPQIPFPGIPSVPPNPAPSPTQPEPDDHQDEEEPEEPEPEEPLPEVIVTGSNPPPAPEAPEVVFVNGAGPTSPVWLGPVFDAVPRPQPRRRPLPRRTKPIKPKPGRRRTAPKPGPAPRIKPPSMPEIVIRAAPKVLGRVLGPLVGLFWPSPIGGGDRTDIPWQVPVLPPQGDDDDEDARKSSPTDPSGLPEYDFGFNPQADVRIRTDPYRQPDPTPIGLFNSPAPFGIPYGLPANVPTPGVRTAPAPRYKTAPNPFLAPEPVNEPLPKPKPAPKTPRIPRPKATPIETLLGPRPITLPQPQPVPKEALDKCKCPPEKKKRQKKKREVCYRGTYTELSNGLIKNRKEKVECR